MLIHGMYIKSETALKLAYNIYIYVRMQLYISFGKKQILEGTEITFIIKSHRFHFGKKREKRKLISM